MNKVEIGKIVGPHGLKGDIKLYPYSNVLELYALDEYFFEDGTKLKVKSINPHKNVYLIRAEGINYIDQVEELRDKIVYVDEDDLPTLDEGSHYVYELLGSKVFDTNDLELGLLDEVVNFGSTDVYVVKDNEGSEIMIPILEDTIVKRDFEQKIIILKVLDGLRDEI